MLLDADCTIDELLHARDRLREAKTYTVSFVPVDEDELPDDERVGYNGSEWRLIAQDEIFENRGTDFELQDYHDRDAYGFFSVYDEKFRIYVVRDNFAFMSTRDESDDALIDIRCGCESCKEYREPSRDGIIESVGNSFLS